MARTLTNEIITAAIDGYESQKARIDAKIAELQAMLPGSSVTSDGGDAGSTALRKGVLQVTKPGTPHRAHERSPARKSVLAPSRHKAWLHEPNHSARVIRLVHSAILLPPEMG